MSRRTILIATLAVVLFFATPYGSTALAAAKDSTPSCAQPTIVNSGTKPVPVNSGSGRRIVVQNQSNWFWAVNADGSVAFNGGIVDNPAKFPAGNYAIWSIAYENGENTKAWGPIRMHDFIGFANRGKVGFHQIPVYATGPHSGCQIHDDSLLGTDQTHSGGCIRVSKWAIEKLAGFVKPGMKVIILV